VNDDLLIPIIIAAAGAVGGFVGWILPEGLRRKPKSVDALVAEPGWFASPVVGAFAALLAWGVTDKVSGHVLIGVADVAARPLQLTWNEVIAAAGTGLLGLKWLSNYQSGKLLRQGVSEVALASASPEVAAAAATAPASRLVAMAREARVRDTAPAFDPAAVTPAMPASTPAAVSTPVVTPAPAPAPAPAPDPSTDAVALADAALTEPSPNY
jgi:hypothetical protein